MLTVADELYYDALDEETRKVCEKIIDSRVEGLVDAEEATYDRGYKEGLDEGKGELDKEVEHQKELAGYVTCLEAQLTHHGIDPNRHFTPPEKPAEGEDFPRPLGAPPAA